jgi:hypothetical protein
MQALSFGWHFASVIGPTTALDGPCAVYRWRDWIDEPGAHKHMICLHTPERIIELGFGRRDDHPEALAVLGDGDDRQLLVICDTPCTKRLDIHARTARCDVFAISD